MPPYQKLYIVLGSGVAISAVVTVLPFDFVYATLFLFVCGVVSGSLWWGKSHTVWVSMVGLGVVMILMHLGSMRAMQQKIHELQGTSVKGIATIVAVQEKEKFTEVVVEFEKNGERLLATVFGGERIGVGSRVSAYCNVGRIENYKGIPYEKMKAVQKIFGSCEKFAATVVDTSSWQYRIVAYRKKIQGNLE